MSDLYRIITERCDIMTHNDERVRFSDVPVAADGRHVVLCRKVLQAELDAGLDTTFHGSWFDETQIELTRIIDSYVRICMHFERSKELDSLREKPLDPTLHVADYIAQHYYDCLSGGLCDYEADILAWLVDKYKLNLDELVYPSDKGSGTCDRGSAWDTLGDWLKKITIRRHVLDTLKDFADELEAPSILALPPKRKSDKLP